MRRSDTIWLLLPIMILLSACGTEPTATLSTPSNTPAPPSATAEHLTPTETTAAAATMTTTAIPPASTQTRPATPTATRTPPNKVETWFLDSIRLGTLRWNTYGLSGAALDREHGLLYVLGQTGDTSNGGAVLTVVQLLGGDIRASVPLSVGLDDSSTVALSADGARLYFIGNEKEPILVVISTGIGQGRLGDVVATRPGVLAITLDEAANRLYALEATHLRRLNAETLTEELAVAVTDVSPAPAYDKLALNRAAGRLYLLRPNRRSIAVFRTGELASDPDIVPGGDLAWLFADPSRAQTYVLSRQFSRGDTETNLIVIQNDRVVATWKGDPGYQIARLTVDESSGHLLLLEDTQPSRERGSRLRLLQPDTGQVLAKIAIPYVNFASAVSAFIYGDQLYRLQSDLLPIMLKNGDLGRPIHLGIGLVAAVLDEAMNRLAVLDSTSTLYLLDTVSLQPLQSWPRVLDGEAGQIERASLRMAQGKIFLADWKANVTIVLDASSGQRLATIPKAGQVIADTHRQRFFLVNQGVYLLGSAYRLSGSIAETLRSDREQASPGALEAIYDSGHDWLFVKMSNNSPGSGASTWLAIYDGKTLKRVNNSIKTEQRFLEGIAASADGERVWVSSSFPGRDLACFDAHGQLLVRLQGLGGPIFPDTARQRTHVLDWSGLVTLDTTDHAVIGYRALPQDMVVQSFDARHGRFYATHPRSPSLMVLVPETAVAKAGTLGPLPSYEIRQLEASADGTLFTVNKPSDLGPAGLFRATKQGWLPIGAGLPPRIQPRILAALDAPGVLFAFSTEPALPYGLFRSTDGGLTWHTAMRGLTDFRVRDIALSPAWAREGTALLLAGEGGLYRSRDAGLSWTQLAEMSGCRVALAADPAGGSLFLVLAAEPNAWQTLVYTSSGQETRLKQVGVIPVPCHNLQVLALSPNYVQDGIALIAGDERGFFRSQDFGRTWQVIGLTFGVTDPTYTIRFSPHFAQDRTVYALIAPSFPGPGKAAALLRSPDGGLSWQKALDADPHLSALAMTPDGQLWAGDTSGQVRPLSAADLNWQPLLTTMLLSLSALVPAPGPTPPPAFQRPEGAFSQLWATEEELGQSLGWAAEPEPREVNCTIQSFQRGFMIRREDTHQIYAFYLDGSCNLFMDTWTPNQPEGDARTDAPEGLWQPIRGFGMVWRNNQQVRAELGWALRKEEDHRALVQAFAQGVLIRVGEMTCVLIAEDGRPTAWYRRP